MLVVRVSNPTCLFCFWRIFEDFRGIFRVLEDRFFSSGGHWAPVGVVGNFGGGGVGLGVVFGVRFWGLDGGRIVVGKNVVVSCCGEEKGGSCGGGSRVEGGFWTGEKG